jgi:CMP-N,N'-diacetyllegionaminic acid synthase
MIDDLNVLAVIPARGGSKGVPLKNLREVEGMPIVELAARVANTVDFIDKVIVSTDHDGIARSAISGGAEAPFMRPKELSGDRVSDVQVLTHSLLEMEKKDRKTYSIIIMLQPTSPLRSKEHIVNSVEMLLKNNFDSVWTVSETDSKSHPYKQLTVKNGKLGYYDKRGKEVIARQQLQPVYHRNGIVYVIRRDTLIEKKSIMGINSGAYIVEGNHLSIDTEFDFKLIEAIRSVKKNSKL